MGNFIKNELISSQTHATFDAFAEKVMEHQLVELLNPAHDVDFDDLTASVLNDWHKRGLIAEPNKERISAMDVARAGIGFVLKCRGLGLESIKSIFKTLDMPMYRDISMLQFAVLACRADCLVLDERPFMVIDGNNSVGLCLAHDLPPIVGDGDNYTYSHTIVNLGRVLNDECAMQKVTQFGVECFLELPRKIAQRLCQPGIKKVKIEPEHNRIYTETNGGENPLFGERVVKYQNGRVVSDVVKSTEVLNG